MKILDVKNVVKVYKNKSITVNALKGINLDFKAGEFVTIVGQSGSGKSTLLRILGGLEEPTDGSVIMENKNLYNLSENERCELRLNKIGFVFQDYSLIPVLSARENVELPMIHCDYSYLDQIFEVLQISDRVNHLPHELSGGQQQRVAIARALINRPTFILADEPTGNLDSESGDNVVGMFRKLVDEFNTTVIMVTHNLDIARITDRTISIKDGLVQ